MALQPCSCLLVIVIPVQAAFFFDTDILDNLIPHHQLLGFLHDLLNYTLHLARHRAAEKWQTQPFQSSDQSSP
jgi:hypothetical protein